MRLIEDQCAAPASLPISSALDMMADCARIVESEVIPIQVASGRISAAAVESEVVLPRFSQSAMDGYGFHRADVAAKITGSFPIVGRVHTGGVPPGSMDRGTAIRLLTGAPVPPEVGAVVMEERVRRSGETIELQHPARLGDNIRRRGEDVGLYDVVLPPQRRIDPRHVGLLAATGHRTVEVVRRIKVGLLSTGNELTEAGQSLSETSVFDSNRPMLMSLLSQPHVELTDLDLIGDDLDRYAAYLHDRHQSLDVIVTTGGVSGSDADYTVRAVQMAGGQSQRIALAIKPGKPFAFGRLGACSVVSLPGNPMAALIGALLFVRPLLLTMSGVSQAPRPGIAAQASAPFVHRLGRTEFVPAIEVGISTSGTPLIRPVSGAGSARLMPLSLADGLAVIPAGETDIVPGGSLLFHRFGSDFAL